MITIDPGVNGHGWAWWVLTITGQHKLCEVGFGQVKDLNDSLIIELPQIYTGSKSKGNPNDLIRVAFAAGTVVNNRSYETVSPRQWKGTIKKEVMTRRILSKLTDDELALLKGLGLAKSFEHNVIDAVGIGLWRQGRL